MNINERIDKYLNAQNNITFNYDKAFYYYFYLSHDSDEIMSDRSEYNEKKVMINWIEKNISNKMKSETDRKKMLTLTKKMLIKMSKENVKDKEIHKKRIKDFLEFQEDRFNFAEELLGL